MLLNRERIMERTDPADWKEKRRLRAFELKKKRMETDRHCRGSRRDRRSRKPVDVSGLRGGKEALRRSVDTGPEKRLSDEDRQKLPALLKSS